jgi:N-acetylneuraminate synthase
VNRPADGSTATPGDPRAIHVSERVTIGAGLPTFVIAEIGYNFNTLDEGLASIDAAADCGVDAVKFQTFRAETIVTRDVAFPPEAGGGNQFDEFKRYELSADWHAQLFARARQHGLVPFSTPSHQSDLPLLERLNTEIYKLGSDDLTNLPFQTAVARLGRPMIISTGMAYLWEVAQTVEAIRQAGNEQLVVLHCLSNYPIKDLAEVNLRAICRLAAGLGVPIGYSDHTTTLSAPVAAVTLGACVYERHFTLDKRLPAPDAALSADPAEMRRIVALIRETERMLGDGRKRPARSERDMRRDTRKSLVARGPIRAGETLTTENVTVKRPGHGIDPRELPLALERAAKRDIPADAIITWDAIG